MAATEEPIPLRNTNQANSLDSSEEPTQVFHEAERWNYPRSNVFKTLATFWSFLVMGMNDAAYGVSDRSPYPLIWNLTETDHSSL